MSTSGNSQIIPEYQVELFSEKKNDYVVYIFVFNEKKLLSLLLKRFLSSNLVGYDIMIGDDGSTDEVEHKNIDDLKGIRC